MADNVTTTGLQRASSGFTLIELMIALVIFAVLSMVAAPNFSDTIKRGRVDSMVRELAGALAMARTEAASRGRPVWFCRSSDVATATTPSCASSSSVTDGWIIWEDTNLDNSLTSADEILRVHDNLVNTRMQMSIPSVGNVSRVPFSRHGFADVQMQFALCEKDQEVAYARALLMERSGRIAHSRRNTTTNVHIDINGTDLTCP